MIFADLSVVAVSFFLGYWLRRQINPNVLPFQMHVTFLPVTLILWGFLLYFFRMYQSFRMKPLIEMTYVIFKTALTAFIVFGSVLYILKITYFSRSFIALVFIIASFLLCLEKAAMVLFFRYTRLKGFNFRNVLIIGTNKRAVRFAEMLGDHREWGFHIVGFIDEDPKKIGEVIDGSKVIGSFEDLPRVIHSHVIDDVVFIVPRSWLTKIEEIVHFCETEGLKIHLAVDHFEMQFARAKQTDLHGFPLITFESAPDKVWHLITKRLFDLVLSGVSMIALFPLFMTIVILVKLTSRGPVFFKQVRCGLNGRRFKLYKFRTMVVGAEKKLEELQKHNQMKGPAFKMENDPRVTSVGRILRKFSLDELPQLGNVLMGDMSLVGPRPPIPKEVEQYDNWHRRRLSMRPGLTCLWQVNGRNKITDFNEWMKLDLEYIDNWSLWLDLKIVFKTVPVVLIGHGAK
jgi:exopolysaccharide biosynthesis polyprenyl glycosylphosphotransferase